MILKTWLKKEENSYLKELNFDLKSSGVSNFIDQCLYLFLQS